LGFYKVLTGYYHDLTIDDNLPPDKVYGGIRLLLQDFAAPFCIYMKAPYKLSYLLLDEDFYEAKASVKASISKSKKERLEFDIQLSGQCISEFHFRQKNLEFKALCTES